MIINKFSSISSIIKDAKKGKMFILVDDKDRENEGDLIIPGSKCNYQSINFMAKHGRGLICLALTKQQIERLLSKNPGKYAVSLAVLGGGCAGFKYEWGFADTKESVGDGDHVEDWQTGKFVVDETSMMYVAGTKIDWKEETFGSQFEISNPNSSSSCGCGESFGI